MGILVVRVLLGAPPLDFPCYRRTEESGCVWCFLFLMKTRSLLTKTCLSTWPSPFTVPLAQPLPDAAPRLLPAGRRLHR